jgi:hypothetical protein
MNRLFRVTGFAVCLSAILLASGGHGAVLPSVASIAHPVEFHLAAENPVNADRVASSIGTPISAMVSMIPKVLGDCDEAAPTIVRLCRPQPRHLESPKGSPSSIPGFFLSFVAPSARSGRMGPQ